MNGKFSERTTPLMISAMRSACSSLSITHGPAMRNRSPEPTRTLSIWKDKVKVIYRQDAESAEKFLSKFLVFQSSRFLELSPPLTLPQAVKSPLAPDQDRQEYHRRPRYPRRCGPCRQ